MAPSLRFGTFGPLSAHALKDPPAWADTRPEQPSRRSTPRMSLFSILVIVCIVAAVVCAAALYSITLS